MSDGKRIGGMCHLVLGEDINTDEIIPGRYLVSIDPAELAPHAFEPLGKDVQAKLARSKVIAAGRNFGCGSAREQAASCLVGAGVRAVLAKSFARVFYRNAINTGLAVIESPAAVAAVSEGDEVYVDLAEGSVEVNGKKFAISPYPAQLRQVLDAGGLISYLRGEFKKRPADERV
jgi:3-isopropylmalate/(R)-2-methylmalate dehydratase small subunit